MTGKEIWLFCRNLGLQCTSVFFGDQMYGVSTYSDNIFIGNKVSFWTCQSCSKPDHDSL